MKLKSWRRKKLTIRVRHFSYHIASYLTLSNPFDSDRYLVTQLKREHKELTDKVNAKAGANSNAQEERELRDKIADVKREVKKVQQKGNKVSLPLENAFWLTYSNELAILNNYLIETYMTKGIYKNVF